MDGHTKAADSGRGAFIGRASEPFVGSCRRRDFALRGCFKSALQSASGPCEVSTETMNLHCCAASMVGSLDHERTSVRTGGLTMAENAPDDGGRAAWNAWNAAHREISQDRVAREQAELIEGWLGARFLDQELRILDVGCGTGWMSERLSHFGRVTAVDIADEVLERARARAPHIEFITGDFLEMDLGTARFDVVVGLESLSHVADQREYLKRIARVLRPGGSLMLATQNRPVMERNIRRLPNPGWYRHWVDRDELRTLLDDDFVIDEVRSITPVFLYGPLHVLNSSKLERLLGRVGLGRPLRWIKRFEEERFLGWTLMCLAHARTTEPPAPDNAAQHKVAGR